MSTPMFPAPPGPTPAAPAPGTPPPTTTAPDAPAPDPAAPGVRRTPARATSARPPSRVSTRLAGLLPGSRHRPLPGFLPGARRARPERVTLPRRRPGARPERSAPATPPARGRERFVRALRRAAPALCCYAAVRLLGLLVLVRWAHRRHLDVWPMLGTQWDSAWYLRIAEHGYGPWLGLGRPAKDLAFFPLYPVLVRALAVVLPGPAAVAGVVLAVAASFLAAWGVFAIGERLHGRRAGTLLTLLWAALPTAVVQWMGYTESLFTALAAWSLYAVLTGRWLWAGTLAALAGLTRPTGLAAAAAVTLAGLVTLWRQRRRGTTGTVPVGARPHPCSRRVLAGTLLAPAGWLGFVGWVGVRSGRWDGYFAVQRIWHNQWDGGEETWRRVRDLFSHDPTPQLHLVLVTATLLVSAVLFVLSVADRQPMPLLVFTGVLLVVTLGSGGVYPPRGRFLLPAFPLLLPAALVLARARPRHLFLVVTAAVCASAYWGAYMLLVWRGAP